MAEESLGGPRVGCGVAILRDQNLLLIRRGRPPEAGCWSLPGGKVDLWEPTEAAARREVAEETGLKLGALELLCVVDYVSPEEGVHWVSPTFLASAFEGEPRLLEPEKHTGLGWFGLDALPDPLTSSVRAAVEVLRLRYPARIASGSRASPA
jgi:ADP-ribose pyrophosphatase YjhB (NUDIX family)